jgi:hypothetical protein
MRHANPKRKGGDGMRNRLIEALRAWRGKSERGWEASAPSDVLGSYTGTAKDPEDATPDQDADDL